ncbi:hypothetical protein [Neobacillus drentensis]|uniref:hypothetical protein n=1 Tax=Neobacillus drentensis TaxID=220684 RepID=UPI002FFEBEFB
MANGESLVDIRQASTLTPQTFNGDYVASFTTNEWQTLKPISKSIVKIWIRVL